MARAVTTSVHRAGAAISVLLFSIVLMTVVAGAAPVRCSVSSPYAEASPILFECNRALAITDYDRDAIRVEGISKNSSLIFPVSNWTEENATFDLMTEEGLFSIKKMITLHDVLPKTILFIAEGGTEVTVPTVVKRISLSGPQPTTDVLFSSTDVPRIRFDGYRYFYYLLSDALDMSGPAVWKFDPLTGRSARVLAPTAGKTVIDVTPTADPAVYAWDELLASGDHRRITSFTDGDEIRRADLLTPVIDGSQRKLIGMDDTQSMVRIVTLENEELTRLTTEEPVIGTAFIGDDRDIPIFWTTLRIWRFEDGEWSSKEKPDITKVKSCGDAVYYLLPQTVDDMHGRVYYSGSRLTDLTVSTDCRLFVVERADDGSNLVLEVTDGEAKVLYETKQRVFFLNR